MFRLALLTALLPALAQAACPAGSQTLFACQAKSGKEIRLCDSGRTLGYSFGRAGRPEIVLNVPRAQASTFQWQGIGRYIHYAVDIPNGNTRYSVYWSLDRNPDTHPTEAGVSVEVDGEHRGSVRCQGEPAVNRLEGIDLPPRP